MRRTRKRLTSDAPLAPVPSEILDQFVGQGPVSHEELEAAVRRFKKAIIERALGGELTHHLGYPPGGTKPEEATNHRNGTGGKTVLTDDGPLPIEVPPALRIDTEMGMPDSHVVITSMFEMPLVTIR